MTYGPDPWQQTQWDWRAALNVACGGAGSGLIVNAAWAAAPGADPASLLLIGLALVGVGLGCVWLEIGRPWRALNVFINPRTSWMTREAYAAALLTALTLAAAAGRHGALGLAGAVALLFAYCQARMVNSARGIPAWRQPMLVPVLLGTALAEGAALLLIIRPTDAAGRPLLMTAFGVLVVLRAIAWWFYRSRLERVVAPPALRALDAAGRVLVLIGTTLPLLLLIGLAASGAAGAGAVLTVALAGVLVLASGLWFKYSLITRAGYNQGFALVHMPVRGTAR